MKKRILIVLCIFLLTAANAFAVEVAWMYVQQRYYGDGRNLNRLSFGLVDDLGNYLADDDRVTKVTLYAPSGKSVELSPHKFGSIEEITYLTSLTLSIAMCDVPIKIKFLYFII